MPKRRRASSSPTSTAAPGAPTEPSLPSGNHIPPTIRSVLGPGADANYLPQYLVSRGINLNELPSGLMDAYQQSLGRSSRAGRRVDATCSSSAADETHEIMVRIVVSPYDNSKPLPVQRIRCNESLESIVDESIRHLVRSKASSSAQRKSSNGRSVADGSYGRNILSLGYVPAKEGHDGAAVPNMATGVSCVHPNSTASYARTSSLMRSIHRLVGDSLLRDMLTTCIVLIPAGNVGGTMRRGNYFQLCGPPLTYYTPVAGRALASCAQDAGDGREQDEEGIDGSCPSPKKKRVKFDEEVQIAQFCVGQQDDSRPALPANPYQKKTLNMPASNSNDCADIDNELSKVADGEQSRSGEAFDPRAAIPRHLMFYSESFVKHPGLPPSHVLNVRDDGKDLGGVAERLLDSMVRLRVPSGSTDPGSGKKKRSTKRRKRWKRLRESGIAMCKEIRRRHQQCDYARLLEHHCPLPNNDNKGSNESNGSGPTLAELSASFVTGNQVASFISSCLWRAFPASFWGSRTNFDVVSSTVARFVKLRRREQMSEGELLRGIKLTEIKWLFGTTGAKQPLSRSDHEAGKILLRNVMHWMYCSYVIPLIRSCFYATETEFTANRVVFYRKPVWTQFRRLAMASLKGRQYTEITVPEAARRNVDQAMGCSKLRLLPKASGVRVLNMLSHAQRVEFCDESEGQVRPSLCRPRAEDRRMSTNATLKRTFAVLKHEQGSSPSSFGCGVFGLNEVFPRLLKFKKELGEHRARCGSSTSKQSAPLFFASVDLHRCYDNIDQNYLFDLVKRIITNDEYLIQQHNVLHPFQSMGKVQRKRSTHLCDPVDIQSFPDLAARELAGNYSQSIFVDGITTSLAKKDEVLKLLKEHIFSNLVAINGDFGPRFLSQSSGIPQGSVLSTMLCNYYYGDLESRLLGEVLEKGKSESLRRDANLLVRIVDDFLLVSTNKDTCERFLLKMRTGIPELGVRINRAKTRTSFDYDVASPSTTVSGNNEANSQIQNIPVGKTVETSSDGSEFFSWCGMLFNTKNCEVRVYYSRFAGSLAVDGLTADRLGDQGEKLILRIKSFVRPRCQPLLFDLRLNTVENALLNFYQAMLFGAVKTVGYVLTGMNGGVKHNPQFIVDCVKDVISYSHALISSRLKAAATSPNPKEGNHYLENDVTAYHLSLPAAEWLGRHAFRAVFTKVDSSHGFGDVICSLSNGNAEIILKDAASYCDYALLCKVANRGLHEFDLDRFDYFS